MAKPASFAEEAAAYYAAKEKNLMPLLRAAAEKIPEREHSDLVAAEEENHARAVDPDWKPKHKDNIYPDPVWPRKENAPPEQELDLKLEDGPKEVNFAAIVNMMKNMREEAKNGKDKESKEAWATIDRLARREGVSEAGGSGGGNKVKGKGKGKGKK